MYDWKMCENDWKTYFAVLEQEERLHEDEDQMKIDRIQNAVALSSGIMSYLQSHKYQVTNAER